MYCVLCGVKTYKDNQYYCNDCRSLSSRQRKQLRKMGHDESREELHKMLQNTKKEIATLERAILSFTNENIKEIGEYDEDMEVIEKDKSRKKFTVQDIRDRAQNRKKDL